MAGATVATIAGSIDNALSRIPVIHQYVLINLGVNDMNVMPTESTWKNNYQTILNSVHAKWPLANVYISKVWRRGYSTEVGTIAGWTDTVISDNSSFCSLADDERGWLEGGDDGATMTVDGVHYSTAGNTEKINQMETVFGY